MVQKMEIDGLSSSACKFTMTFSDDTEMLLESF